MKEFVIAYQNHLEGGSGTIIVNAVNRKSALRMVARNLDPGAPMRFVSGGGYTFRYNTDGFVPNPSVELELK